MTPSTAQTPETDGQLDDPYSIHLMNTRAERHNEEGRKKFGLTLTPCVVDADFARRLERERDEARALLKASEEREKGLREILSTTTDELEHKIRMEADRAGVTHCGVRARMAETDPVVRIARAALSPQPNDGGVKK